MVCPIDLERHGQCSKVPNRLTFQGGSKGCSIEFGDTSNPDQTIDGISSCDVQIRARVDDAST